jgi:predicted kinase
MKRATVKQITTELKRHDHHYGVVLIGCPGSGKSTFTKSWLEDFPNTHIASTDAMIDEYAAKHGITYTEAWGRISMKHYERTMFAQMYTAINEHKHVLVDQTNMSIKIRAKKIAHLGTTKLVAIVFDVPDEELYRRLDHRARTTGKIITSGIVKNMLKNYQEPTKEEGFSYIWTLKE